MAGQEQLKAGIIEKGLCSGCGMCVGLCPYIRTFRDRVSIINPCGLQEGACYHTCPKTALDVSRMDSFVFNSPRKDQALGVYSGLFFARAAGKSPGAQYGGVATGLMAFAVESGIIEGAVMTGGDPLDPKPVYARSGREVMSCAGSKYTAVPSLSAFNQAVRDGGSRIGLVGRPCQVEAVRKLQQGSHPGSRGDREKAVGLVLGLFCFWSLAPEFYHYLAARAGGEAVSRVDIPLEGLTVTTPGGPQIWPVDEIRQYIKESCHACIDCTAEWADLSVGSTEHDPEYNTLVVRTEAGRRLVEAAAEKGAIELRPFPEERIPILRKAALNKKMRVLQGNGQAPGYLDLTGEYMSEIRKQWEVLQ